MPWNSSPLATRVGLEPELLPGAGKAPTSTHCSTGRFRPRTCVGPTSYIWITRSHSSPFGAAGASRFQPHSIRRTPNGAGRPSGQSMERILRHDTYYITRSMRSHARLWGLVTFLSASPAFASNNPINRGPVADFLSGFRVQGHTAASRDLEAQRIWKRLRGRFDNRAPSLLRAG